MSYLISKPQSLVLAIVIFLSDMKTVKFNLVALRLNLIGVGITKAPFVNFSVNTLRPRHNGRHFTDDIFKCIFLNENIWILIKISLKFVPNGPNNYIPALVQIMAWRWPGDKPLSEPMMVKLLTHICVTRPQWVEEVFDFAEMIVTLFEWLSHSMGVSDTCQIWKLSSIGNQCFDSGEKSGK